MFVSMPTHVGKSVVFAILNTNQIISIVDDHQKDKIVISCTDGQSHEINRKTYSELKNLISPLGLTSYDLVN